MKFTLEYPHICYFLRLLLCRCTIVWFSLFALYFVVFFTLNIINIIIRFLVGPTLHSLLFFFPTATYSHLHIHIVLMFFFYGSSFYSLHFLIYHYAVTLRIASGCFSSLLSLNRSIHCAAANYSFFSATLSCYFLTKVTYFSFYFMSFFIILFNQTRRMINDEKPDK